MLTASQAFHQAIYGRNPDERIMMLFNEPQYGITPPSIITTIMAWTDEDVSANSGVRIQESVNQNSELMIGQALASTMNCTIFNEHGRLTHYMTQEAYSKDCHVYMGVKTATATAEVPEGANCVAYIRDSDSGSMASGICITGHSEAPYVRINGTPLPIDGSLPDFAVHSIIVDTGSLESSAYILCLGLEEDQYYGITWEYGDTWEEFFYDARDWGEAANFTWGDLMGTAAARTFTTSYWMKKYKFPRLASSHRGFLSLGTNLYEYYTDGTCNKWEYLPVGVFRMERPKVRDQYACSFSAYDRMTLFDVDVTEWLDGLSYPMTIRELLEELCEHVGVEDATGYSFINSSVSVSEAPQHSSGKTTGRQLLQMIAEAACANAKMDRYGRLQLAWISNSASRPVGPEQTIQTVISDYTVSKIDHVQIEVPQEDDDPVVIDVGTGTNTYDLTSNPLLISGTTSQVESKITNIYNRLNGLSVFRPVVLDWLCDWSVEPGDAINLWYAPAGGSVSISIYVPVYTQTIDYKGIAKSRVENSGEATRPVNDLYGISTQNGLAHLYAQTNALSAQIERQAARSVTGYIVCSTAAATAAKEATTSGTPLTSGRLYVVFFGNGNSAANPTFSLNGSTALPILSCYGNAAVTTSAIPANMTALFIYTGSAWILLNPSVTSAEARI